LLRNFLLREEGGTLCIGQGIPRAWLEPGKHVAVTSAPTEFGSVSYRIEPEEQGLIRIRLDPPLRRPPSQIRIFLRDAKKRKIATAQAVPAREVEVDGESILVRNLRAPVEFLVGLKIN
jgi:hypothetical protein